jgi:predicted transposase/invertase (TIGR01784 family)
VNIKNQNLSLFEDNRSRFYNVEKYNELIDSFCKKKGYTYFEIHPLHDLLFYEYMGRKGCEQQLLALINAILEDKGYPPIKKIEIIEDRRDKIHRFGEKKTIRDIRAITDDNTTIHLEAQRQGHKGFNIRLFFYSTGEIRSTIDEGKNYHEIPNMIQIAIVDDIIFPPVPEYHNILRVCLDGYPEMRLIPQYRSHIIELPKATKNEKLDINNPLHRFILFFNPHTSKKIMKKIMKMDEQIKMANDKLISLLKSQEEEHYKLLDKMAELDHNTFIFDAKKEGETIGLQKGESIGLKKGESIGLKKGRKEGESIGLKKGEEKAKIEFALRLLDENVPILKISEYTGLSITKIQSLRYGK